MKPAIAGTVDAIYKESKKLIDSLREKGADIVNMESAPFYSTSNYFNLQSLWIGCVSDCIFNNKWKDWSNTESITSITGRIARKLLLSVL